MSFGMPKKILNIREFGILIYRKAVKQLMPDNGVIGNAVENIVSFEIREFHQNGVDRVTTCKVFQDGYTNMAGISNTWFAMINIGIQ